VDSNDCFDAMDPITISMACGAGMNLFEPVDDSDDNGVNDVLTMGARFHGVSVSIVGMGENKVDTEGCGGCASGRTATHVLLFLLAIGYIKRRFAMN
jgi:hypothetical protein